MLPGRIRMIFGVHNKQIIICNACIVRMSKMSFAGTLLLTPMNGKIATCDRSVKLWHRQHLTTVTAFD